MQVAALPWRIDADGKMRILLVTSRTNGKWMLPKGWPMPKMTPAQAALVEAREEAGVDGAIAQIPIGSYRYVKLFADGSTKPSQALIYALRVEDLKSDWDEKGQRVRRWFRPKKAAKVVFEQDLARFMMDLSAERIVMFGKGGRKNKAVALERA
jgi:8-oxo-dGTP pyrophosphatase MutT (NUDIX family)